MIQGATEGYVVVPPNFARLISLIVTEALGEERARELRARCGEMHWDQAVAPRPPKPSTNSNPGTQPWA
jgi:hypothetical protein